MDNVFKSRKGRQQTDAEAVMQLGNEISKLLTDYLSEKPNPVALLPREVHDILVQRSGAMRAAIQSGDPSKAGPLVVSQALRDIWLLLQTVSAQGAEIDALNEMLGLESLRVSYMQADSEESP